MTKQTILTAFRDTITSSDDLSKAIFGTNPIPDNLETTPLKLSSIDFVDLLIDVEDRLGIDFADELMTLTQTTIGDLVERIASHA